MDSFEKFYNYALKFLSYRPRSEKEIRDRLKVKSPAKGEARHRRQKSKVKIDESIIDKIIQKLKDQKFIDDKEFAKWWIEQRTNFKPIGLRLIKLELKQKGIDNELIEQATYDLRLKNDDLENAKKLVEKRIEKLKGLPIQEVYQKLGSFLARRGFDWETIKDSIDEVLKKRV